jgi:hypothetical protein
MKRKEWMRQRANNTNWDAGISAELIKRYGTIVILDEAKGREGEGGGIVGEGGRESIICSHSSFFTLFLSFPVYCHLVFSHVFNLCRFLPLISSGALALAPSGEYLNNFLHWFERQLISSIVLGDWYLAETTLNTLHKRGLRAAVYER